MELSVTSFISLALYSKTNWFILEVQCLILIKLQRIKLYNIIVDVFSNFTRKLTKKLFIKWKSAIVNRWYSMFLSLVMLSRIALPSLKKFLPLNAFVYKKLNCKMKNKIIKIIGKSRNFWILFLFSKMEKKAGIWSCKLLLDFELPGTNWFSSSRGRGWMATKLGRLTLFLIFPLEN